MLKLRNYEKKDARASLNVYKWGM